MTQWVVQPLALNLRSAADPARKNVLVVLGQGTAVRKLADAARPGWVEVEAQVGGRSVRGFVNAAYLLPGEAAAPQVPLALPAADLGASPFATRIHAGSRAHALGEAGRPDLPSTHAEGAAAGVLRVIDWCAVERAAHKRWWPNKQTYCNIYAYDVSHLCGAYLPRVWWTNQAIAQLNLGQAVPVRYAVTVNELAANYMYNWLVEHGASFGWQRHFTAAEVQDAANAGRVAVLCAQRSNLNSPGHIQIIAAEHGEQRAKRVAGRVTQPLQSNAGSHNFRYGQLSSSWWQGSSFAAFGFWSAASG